MQIVCANDGMFNPYALQWYFIYHDNMLNQRARGIGYLTCMRRVLQATW